MKHKLTLSAVILSSGLIAFQACASAPSQQAGQSDHIDWSQVSPGYESNNVSRTFVAAPNTLNTILDNDFTAWYPQQYAIDNAFLPTGRVQRLAVLGPSNQSQTQQAGYTESNVSIGQTGPSGYYSEGQGTQQQPGTVSGSESQSGTATSGSSMSTTQGQVGGTQASSMSNQKQSQSVYQSTLAPHALVMESSLNSALQQLKGMKSEVNLSQNQHKLTREQMNTYKTFLRQIRNDLNLAQNHERMLYRSAMRYPELAKDQDLKNISPAFNSAHQALSKLESKAGQHAYWTNSNQVLSDISNVENQLNNVIQKTSSFSSSKLNTSIS